MKIVDVSVDSVRIPLKTPFKTALRMVEAVEDVLVYVKCDDQSIGYGEAAPTAAITGETAASIRGAILEYIRPAILGMNPEHMDEIMIRLHGAIKGNTSAKAAVDMALYDLLAQRCGMPLYRLLGGARKELETDLTISMNPAEEMTADSLRAVEDGYRILKIKVGRGGAQDVERVRSVRRAVGDSVRLRVDANQGWDPKQSVRNIRAMEDLGLDIELVEQPVRAHDLEGMAFVTSRVDTPILADESVFTAEDAVEIIRRGAADMLNIKLMKTGGIYKALQICAVAEAYSIPCMIGCMMEGKISVAAAAHLAGAKTVISLADLDGPGLCAEDPYIGGPLFRGRDILLNDNPGIGIIGLRR